MLGTGRRRMPRMHGFSTKNIRTKLRNQEALNGISEGPGVAEGEEKQRREMMAAAERELHKMGLIWNEFERLKIKFHELVDNNHASIESIPSQGAGQAVSSRSSPSFLSQANILDGEDEHKPHAAVKPGDRASSSNAAISSTGSRLVVAGASRS